jgi:hypothetical protein
MTSAPDESVAPDEDPSSGDFETEPPPPVTEPDVEGDNEVVAPDPVADI